MVSADGNRPIAGSGQRGGKPERPGKKAEKRRRKPAQKSGVKPDAALEASEAALEASEASTLASEAPTLASEAPVDAPEALVEAIEVRVEASEVPMEALDAVPEAPEQALEQAELPRAPIESPPSFVAAGEVPPTAPATPPAVEPVNAQTIANAYGNYTQKSFEQTMSFFEQLAGARSFNKALALQADFARQTYETFVAESKKIRELHSELAKQRLRSLEGFVTGKNVRRST
jgi:hypothetical protein